MAGDTVHHSGELRPHPWHPLPKAILPHPFTMSTSSVCPGELFEGVLRDRKDSPFYLPASGPHVHYDIPTMIESIEKLQEADAHDDILFVAAHDDTLSDIVDYFPKTANDFVKKGWVKQARWRFLRDFAKAAGYTGKIVAETDYSPAAENV
ncbi:uncharacterized protein K452DRAFT_338416 [Aplosporella prunicola CBS 121167]|uniref:Uncharacterized protein n=1 Tax=Aplosporella prunicola CBS 121167 TaxID=1176127 RepID=A0A6A6ASV0_9PEZI|nr:uncharacterized protein K452DRAFT_338416 [Aplosporella prunicola CBS 121167]KAF2135102.1 hypothetical protein K452DRAFT_338416 [Aplosporella prunicola CBS 121167]